MLSKIWTIMILKQQKTNGPKFTMLSSFNELHWFIVSKLAFISSNPAVPSVKCIPDMHNVSTSHTIQQT